MNTIHRCWPSLRCIASRISFAVLILGAVGVHGAEQWEQIGFIDAPEARQAAAADDRFAYAVDNTTVAKYDRVTGERVAVSSGPAEHLNSAFFWQGKLYAAHSNYPQKPEQSEIKVLDPESMQLTTFHDFGESEGSLTWAVYHDGAWWCHFAYYGANNAKSYLAKFNSDWTEHSRWSYPPSVIEQLGRYSVSGGIWRGDELLVTGHDDPVVFRLRLPTTGTVLERVGEDEVPFTGQGIAEDPATNGLVGISRPERQIRIAAPPASQPLRLRVLSYNIHHAVGMDSELDLERIARVILLVNPDVVSIQEVDQNVRRSENVDQPAELARLTNMHFVFGANISLQGGKYGNVILSRFPIQSEQNHLLPNIDQGEQRGLLDTIIELPGDRPALRFLATHFDHRRDDRERVASAKMTVELVEQHPDQPVILAGDINARPDSAPVRELLKAFDLPHEQELPTIPVANPRRQIDYIMIRPTSRWRAVETVVLDEAVASDHRAIFSVLELLPVREPGA